jgi:hypothetical protein
MTRLFRAPTAQFLRDAELADQVYTADALKRLADLGFNGVWIRMVYRRLLKNPRYPSFGDQAEHSLPGLCRVIERGERCGLKVYAYLQEPLGLATDDPFWEHHPKLGGATYNHQNPFTHAYTPMRAFCTSTEAGKDFLTESSEHLVRQLPGLGGVIMITASEFISHCYSKYYPARNRHHGDQCEEPLRCPRCRERHPSDVVAEILNLIRMGIDRANEQVALIAWNWAWHNYEPDPQTRILAQLSSGIDCLVDFERGGYKADPDGKIIYIDEYSLSYEGPSERFLRLKHSCDKLGRTVYAKLQIGTTHELATVSNLPLFGKLFDKAQCFKQLRLAGFMGCWAFGLDPSLNLAAFNFFLSNRCPSSKDEALAALATQELPGCDTAKVLEAWGRFDSAFDHYPFSMSFLYQSPINYSLALPFEPGPVQGGDSGRSWVIEPRGDDLASSCGPFSAEEVVQRLTRLLALWRQGLVAYEAGLKGAGGRAAQELSAARAVFVSVRSVRNSYRLYLLKRNWSDDCLPQYRDIVQDELETLDDAIPVYECDPRQGFHQEPSTYMVTADAMKAKRARLRRILS